MEDQGSIEVQVNPDALEMQRQTYLGELLDWCNQFITRSRNWRRESFEAKWQSYQRASDSIYEPTLRERKEAWQSKAYIPITASHRETIQAALYKTMVGPRPMLEIKSRGTIPDQEDQSQNIRDLILREVEKARFELRFNSVLEEATTYGSGFARIRWDEEYEERKVRQPVIGQVDPLQAQMMAAQGQMPGQVQGYEDVYQPVQTYRGVRFEPISIWDVFPDPDSIEIAGSPVAIRYQLAYGDIVKGVNQGYYLPEAADKLRDVEETQSKTDDKQIVDADRGIGDSKIKRPDYGRKHTCFEVYARLPKKWVIQTRDPQAEVGDNNELIPARIQFHERTILAIEPAGEYDGEPPIYKLDYLPVAGQFYGRGVPEMLKDLQEVVNETVNQRIDNVSLVINRMFAVNEKAVVDPRDFTSKPGGMVRINSKMSDRDIRTLFQPLEIPDVTVSAYRDVIEMERYAQERTSANRVTIGTAGQVKDANQTLGGMELLKQSAGEKFAYIGMLMEFGFLQDVFRAFWKAIYSNITPEDVLNSVGPERTMTFQLLTPEQIEQDYVYTPTGVHTMENKALLQARIQAIVQMYGQQPWFDLKASFDKVANMADIDPNELALSPEEMQQRIVAQGIMDMPPQAGQQQGPPQ